MRNGECWQKDEMSEQEKYNVVKQDLKNGKDLDNICFKEVSGKDIIWFAET